MWPGFDQRGFDIMMMLTKAARTLVLVAEAARMIQRPREEKSDSPFSYI
jgi:hypothetical protein